MTWVSKKLIHILCFRWPCLKYQKICISQKQSMSMSHSVILCFVKYLLLSKQKHGPRSMTWNTRTRSEGIPQNNNGRNCAGSGCFKNSLSISTMIIYLNLIYTCSSVSFRLWTCFKWWFKYSGGDLFACRSHKVIISLSGNLIVLVGFHTTQHNL